MEMFNNSHQKNVSIFIPTSTTMAVDDGCKVSLLQGTILIVFNSVLALLGTFGNFLIIFAVLITPQLRKRKSNFLLVSLAIADLMTTMIAQPLLATSIAFKTFANRCSRGVDMGYIIVSPFSGSSSVYHLAAISIDRAICALKPHQHRDIINKRFKLMLCTCWATATVVRCSMMQWPTPPINITSQGLLGLSFIVMVSSYGTILYKIKFSNSVGPDNTMPSNAHDSAMEKRVSGTIAIIIVLFVCCWSPLFVYYLVNSSAVFVRFSSIRTLYLANSSMNFIVYSWRIRHFRVAYGRIITQIVQRFEQAAEKCCCTIIRHR